jgi:hypothetical protein
MGTFRTAVRKGKIVSPLRRDFDVAAWLALAKPDDGIDTADLKLALSGVLFDRKLKLVWGRLASLQLEAFRGDQLRQAYVALANRDFATLRGDARRLLEEFSKRETLYMEEMLSSKASRALNGREYSIDDLATSSVDGLHMPLRKTFDCRGSERREIDFRSVRDAVLLGQLQATIASIWEDCVWCDWEFTSREKQMIAVPADQGRAQARAVGNARSVALASLMTQHGFNLWRRMSESARVAIASSRPNVSIVGSGRRMKLRNDPAEIDPRAPIQSFNLRVIASELYFRDLFECELPTLPGVTLGVLLSAWEVLYSFGEALAAKLPQRSAIEEVEDLWQFAPRIPRTQLADLLRRTLGISLDQGSRIIRFLTFSEEQPDELWARPFVDIDGTMVAPVLTCLLTPNPLRMVERWMKNGGLELQGRGDAFEREARQRIGAAFKSSRLLKDGGVCDHAYKLKIKANNPGDIDLIIWFGDTVLIGEVKCQLFPAKASEFFNYFSDLEKAGEQIIRKAAAFESLTSDFWLRVAKKQPPLTTKIIPFILTNLPLGVALQFNGVSATDVLVLERFVGEGFLERFVSFNSSSGHSGGERLEFYRSADEAEACVASYLADPPQLHHFRDALKLVFNPLPTVDDNDEQWGVMDYSVEMETNRLDTLRRSPSTEGRKRGQSVNLRSFKVGSRK